MKFCKDCIHYRSDKNETSPYCNCPENRDVVSGEMRASLYRTCADIRKNSVGACGMDGSWFQSPTPSFIPSSKENT